MVPNALAMVHRFELQDNSMLYLSKFSNTCPFLHLPGELLTFQAFSGYLLLLGVSVSLV